MEKPELLAHSARRNLGIAAQPYHEHVRATRCAAVQRSRVALAYRVEAFSHFADIVDWAATFHDLGKLESENQQVLASGSREHLPIDHVDAGVAHLRTLGYDEAACAIYAHHRGLCNVVEEYDKEQRSISEPELAAFRNPQIKLQTDQRLAVLLDLHRRCTQFNLPLVPVTRPLSNFERRLLLSCLVDADHTDTAFNYKQQPKLESVKPRWDERISALDKYVANLERKHGPRDPLRKEIYAMCSTASPETPIWACEAAVGTGKTTAVMAYLLRAAKKLELRHIFVVLPFTNIVDQSVKVYRKALVLEGEKPEMVVAAHHHAIHFQDVDLRYLTTLWEAPIIVTTAVQFFETLVGNHPSRLRKLHQLPGSGVFIDEAHAAMPIHLWPFMWDQVEELSRGWKCRFVLASGSLARFWENPRIIGKDRVTKIPPMISETLHRKSELSENKRIRYQTKAQPMTLKSLCDWIQGLSGARLVVVNTVHSAALLARELRRRLVHTLHLSTALAPIDRTVILRRATRYLKWCKGLNWVMVATSCIEAGVDLSFDVALRERCRVCSLIQVGGRVNREASPNGGTVWDFVVDDLRWKKHPDFEQTRPVVEEVFKNNMWEGASASELTTCSLGEEFKRRPQEDEILKLRELEDCGNYPAVAKASRLISTDTRLVIVDPELAQRVRNGEKIDHKDLLLRSVQLWATRIQKLKLSPIGWREEAYEWPKDGYDNKFLGIMDWVLKLDDIEDQGYAII